MPVWNVPRAGPCLPAASIRKKPICSVSCCPEPASSIWGLQINWLAGLLAALTSVIYLFAYTPLKRVSTHNTAVGAVAGALPPMGGWAAAQGEIGSGAWMAVRYRVFLAVSALFLHRMDLQGGLRARRIQDGFHGRSGRPANGRSDRHLQRGPAGLFRASVAWRVCVVRSMPPRLRPRDSASCIAVTTFAGTRSERNARRLLRTTLVYLPLLWIALLFDTFL